MHSGDGEVSGGYVIQFRDAGKMKIALSRGTKQVIKAVRCEYRISGELLRTGKQGQGRDKFVEDEPEVSDVYVGACKIFAFHEPSTVLEHA